MSIILPTALELAEGLGYLHEQGILHGDLSPGNVLLANEPGAPHGFIVKVCYILDPIMLHVRDLGYPK